jgi:hypothetical protein
MAAAVEAPAIRADRYFGCFKNGAMTIARFNIRYFAGLRARLKAELELRKPFEKASGEECADVTARALTPYERVDLKFYESVQSSLERPSVEFMCNVVDFGEYANIADPLKDGSSRVDIYASPRPVKGNGERRVVGRILKHVILPPPGFVIPTYRGGNQVLYDNVGLAGLAPETHHDKNVAFALGVPFYEKMITDLDPKGTIIIDPRDVSWRETSLQWVSDGDCPGLSVPTRDYKTSYVGPLHTSFCWPVHYAEELVTRSRLSY